MSVVPKNVTAFLEFCEQHWPVWEAAPLSIGLQASQITQFKALTIAARASYEAALAARQASKAATIMQNTDVSAARESASDLVRQIKAFAALQEKPGEVYSAAEIPEDQPPTPMPAPGKPTNLLVNLEPSGAVTVSWEATDSAASTGAFFNIMRKLPGQSAFVPLTGAPGSTAESRRSSFTDYTVPASAAGSGAQYIIQGRRGTLTGIASDAITVQFGVDGTGATVIGATLMKAAA